MNMEPEITIQNEILPVSSKIRSRVQKKNQAFSSRPIPSAHPAPSFIWFLQQHLRENQLTIYNLNNGFRVWLRNAPGFTQTTDLFNLVTPVSGVRLEQSWMGEERTANVTDSLGTKRWYSLLFVITTVLTVSRRQGYHLSDLL